jgi:IS5 family transposase
MQQRSFSSLGFDRPHKQIQRERFLAEMEIVDPWAALSALIEPHYPSGERGRPPIGIERMLRIYFLQQWFNMSDPQTEDSFYDSAAMRNVAGIDHGNEAAPDETTICKFRHLIENNGLSKMMLTAANVHDSQMVPSLLHGAETKVWGDTAYQGQTEAIWAAAPAAQDMTQRRGSRGHPLSAEERAKNATKSRVRAKGEHPLLIIKRIFGFTHVRYRGLAKNGTRFEVLCALANLYTKRRVLMRYCHA